MASQKGGGHGTSEQARGAANHRPQRLPRFDRRLSGHARECSHRAEAVAGAWTADHEILEKLAGRPVVARRHYLVAASAAFWHAAVLARFRLAGGVDAFRAA